MSRSGNRRQRSFQVKCASRPFLCPESQRSENPVSPHWQPRPVGSSGARGQGPHSPGFPLRAALLAPPPAHLLPTLSSCWRPRETSTLFLGKLLSDPDCMGPEAYAHWESKNYKCKISRAPGGLWRGLLRPPAEAILASQ